ncbi:hypothetical protein [Bartonella birtlesii]|uniref:Uncharacterized protein n=1 Tax=Bartonella birtlesii LL-WM9 TaxID=1094552 RepID=J1IZ55_9HYPH|nr:hypothetical protein [Bartonella birtlesii]EJF76580.1 hypothetical protein ME7_00837 [Bartonella birtlesii LL-WM9]
MTSSFVAFLTLSFLSSTIAGFLVIVPVFIIYYLFIKRARLYCKVNKQHKKLLQVRQATVKSVAKTEKQDQLPL